MTRMAARLRAPFGLIALAIGLLAVTPAPAWAYIDPGTGSYLFQIAAAGLLAGMYTMRRYWFALTRAWRGRGAAAGSSKPPVTPANDLE